MIVQLLSLFFQQLALYWTRTRHLLVINTIRVFKNYNWKAMISMISCLFNLIEWNSQYTVTRGILSEFQSSRTLRWCIFLVSLLHEYLYLENPYALHAVATTTRVECLSLRGGCSRILSSQSFLSSLSFPLPLFLLPFSLPISSPSYLFFSFFFSFLLSSLPRFLPFSTPTMDITCLLSRRLCPSIGDPKSHMEIQC